MQSKFTIPDDLTSHALERGAELVDLDGKGGILELVQVFRRVPESIGVVGPQSGDFALPNELQNELVSRREHVGSFDRNCCQFVFFFSSRRRHTRYIGDWSSDVCSSD